MVILEANHNGKTYRLAFGGEGIGYYLYVFAGDKCTHDYLQDTVADAKEFALETFGVPPEGWRTVTSAT